VKRVLDEREVVILESIRDVAEPVGSWNLVDMLERRGQAISSASIGRILHRLETLGFVESQTNKGRILTKKGFKAIDESRTIITIDRHKSDLEALISSRVLDEFVMVLQARKAIERETARLAAIHATDAKLGQLESLIAEQEEKASRGESVAEVDVAFHKGIAEASKNEALKALYGILAMMGQQSDLFEYVRSRVNNPYRKAHRAILDALAAHDPEAAERSMINHMDSLIEDVSRYWEQFKS
jgi:GntR family transcriptional repressor for pyruvate dehydrogenase complex